MLSTLSTTIAQFREKFPVLLRNEVGHFLGCEYLYLNDHLERDVWLEVESQLRTVLKKTGPIHVETVNYFRGKFVTVQAHPDGVRIDCSDHRPDVPHADKFDARGRLQV
jgi:hypothetical protein